MQEDTLKLQHLLDANLLSKREDVEDLAAAAVKEKQIERKLDVLRGEWAVQDVRFMEHKNRGAVVIKPADYAELVEKLEESQMNLSSMATNRYSKPFEADVWLPSTEEWLPIAMHGRLHHLICTLLCQYEGGLSCFVCTCQMLRHLH
jgi:hypothetical protein